MELAIFLIFAGLALGSSLVVVLHHDPVKSTLSLVVTLFATGVLFVLLGAPFLGVLQVLVYAGAIVVLFLFVVMLLNLSQEARRAAPGGRGQRLFALAGALAFALYAGAAVWSAAAAAPAAPLTEAFVALRALSEELFGRYLLAFEIAGLLLLVAVIGAFILAKRPEPAAGGPEAPAGTEPGGEGAP